MGKVNLIQLKREIERQEARLIAPRMKNKLNKAFEVEKNRFLKEFDSHPVNKELEKGPNGESSIIKTKKGGNLYSLLGFVDGVEPVRELRDALEDGISKGHVTKDLGAKKIKYNLEVRVPTLTELKRKTQLLTWTTRSFVDLVENGISNFRRYLFDRSGRLKKYSKSGTAIQADRDVRDKEFNGVPYLTKMIKKFQDRLKGINKKK